MADPTTYTPGYSYTGYQETDPNTPLPGPQVDNDFANISTSITSLVNSVKDVRRSDGKLKNALVTLDSLSPEVTALFGGTINIGQLPSAADYAAIRAIPADTDDVIVLNGASVIVTQAELRGIFTYDENETAADNGGTVIVDDTGRRWIRQFNGDCFASWWGYVASTSTTVSDGNADAINDAITALSAANGGRLNIGFGAGSIRKNIRHRSKVTLCGYQMGASSLVVDTVNWVEVGRGGIITNGDIDDWTVGTMTGEHDIGLEDLTIDGGGLSNSGNLHAFRIHGAEKVWSRRVEYIDCVNGTAFVGTDTTWEEGNVVLVNANIKVNAGLDHWGGFRNAYVVGNKIKVTRNIAFPTTQSLNGYMAQGIQFTASGTDLEIANADGFYCAFNTIEGVWSDPNVIVGAGSSIAVNCLNDSSSIKNGRVIGNKMLDGEIACVVSGNASYITFNANTPENCSNSAFLHGNEDPFAFTSPSYITLTNHYEIGCTSLALSGAAYIFNGGVGHTIGGNSWSGTSTIACEIDADDWNAANNSWAPDEWDLTGSTGYNLDLDFYTLSMFRANGDGVTSDTAAVQRAAAMPGITVRSDPRKTYLITSGVLCDGTTFEDCKFELKLGSGGFSSIDVGPADRYDTDRVAFHWLNDNGGGFHNCDFFGDGGGDYVCIPVAVTGGRTTKPFRMSGHNRMGYVPGVTGVFCTNMIGVAGLTGSGTLEFIDVTTDKMSGTANTYGGAGYWISDGSLAVAGFTQVTGWAHNGDSGSTYLSAFDCSHLTIRYNNVQITGAAYAKHGSQADVVTFAGLGKDTLGGTLGAIIGTETGEVVDCQAQNVRIGSIYAEDTCFAVLKGIHGCAYMNVGSVEFKNVGRVGALLAGSSGANTLSDGIRVGAVRGTGVGDYVLRTGTLQSATASTAVLDSGASAIDYYYTGGAYGGVIVITSGTGAGQERLFSVYTGSTKTVSTLLDPITGLASNWAVTPDNTSVYRIMPFVSRCAAAIETEGTFPVKNAVIDNVAVFDTGYLDYIGRSNYATAGLNNQIVVEKDLGYQRAPIVIGSQGPVRMKAGPTLRGISKLRVTANQAVATTAETALDFGTKVFDSYDIPGTVSPQCDLTDKGLRPRLPGAYTFDLLAHYASPTSGDYYAVSLKRDGSAIRSVTQRAVSNPLDNEIRWPFYVTENLFGDLKDGTNLDRNLFTASVTHGAATSATISAAEALSQFAMTN